MKRRFFQSRLHPHCWMNRFGVVFVPNGHGHGVSYFGASYESVPVDTVGRPEVQAVREAVENEAREAGYTGKFVGRDYVWSKPLRAVTA